LAFSVRPSNPLALAVLALLFERPMHPYEMAAIMKERRKADSIKIRYGSLYTVITLLEQRGLIAAKETSREGKRPERTVYVLTPAGRDELMAWMQDLLREPVHEYPQFVAGLSLLPVLPPDQAVALLRYRAVLLSGECKRLEAQLAQVMQQDVPVGFEPLPQQLIGQKFPPLFVVETEYRLALTKAELSFVNDLVRRVDEEGWGPRDLWAELQAQCLRQHGPFAEEGAM
jgi:DNA-binding PadR family transcriptional regulator